MIAPRGVFDFQQDYLDVEGTRYFALRIPYSIIHELHTRSFSALRQPSDEADVNDTIDSVGFDFIQPPEVTWTVNMRDRPASLVISDFASKGRTKGGSRQTGMDALSMVLLDFDYDGGIFKFDKVFFADELRASDYVIHMPADWSGEAMAVFLDIYGNESRVLLRPRTGN